jgi:hypothetical protein
MSKKKGGNKMTLLAKEKPTAYVVSPSSREKIEKMKTDKRVMDRIKRDAQLFREHSLKK